MTAPAGAEDIHFSLTHLEIEGQYSELAAVGAEIARRNELHDGNVGGWVSVADIYRFANELQQAYLNAGYPLARIIVPAQTLGADGVVRIQVIDGFVESLDLDGVPVRARNRVRAVMTPLVGVHKPTRQMLERRLLLAGDTAGLTLRTTMTPGGALGATVLVLSGEHRSVFGTLSADNRVADEYGRAQVAASVAFNSPFGAGEQVYGTIAGYPGDNMLEHDARRRYFAAGASVPLGNDGLSAHLALDYSSTRPQGDVAALKLASEYAREGVGLSYPIVRSRRGNLVAHADFDAVSETQDTRITGTPQPLSADRLRVIRLGLDASGELHHRTRAAISFEYAQGLDALGARSADEATALKPLSRQGADAEFSKFNAQASAQFQFESGAVFSAVVDGQISFGDPLVRSEQYSPISPTGLSGPPPSAIVGDAGATARFELQAPSWGNQDAFAAPYLFGAASEVRLEQPSALELPHTRAREVGVGLRIGDRHSGQAFAASVEYSLVESNDQSLDRSWVSASVSYRF